MPSAGSSWRRGGPAVAAVMRASDSNAISLRAPLTVFVIIVALALTLVDPFEPDVAAIAQSGTPTVALSPTSGAPGTVVVATGANFPRTTVQLQWDGGTVGMPAAQTTRRGSFRTTFIVPSISAAGAHSVAAVATKSGSTTATAAASFAVVTGSTAAVPTATPTIAPTPTPTLAPTPAPTLAPTPAPTLAPTPAPTLAPTPMPTPTAAPAGAGTRISWQGRSYYLHGANVPWFNWGCDFGCGANGGVSSASVKAALDARFAQAVAAGMHTIRFWVFEGDAWQITRDATSKPTGVNPAVYADFDAAMALAVKYDLYYDFVLFSSPTTIPLSWQTDATQRQALATALGPLFARYRTNTHVLSWEVYNEPDFDIWNGKIAQSAVTETTRLVAASVHANSGAYVTVGTGFLDGLPMFTGLGLDYYQSHWYDYMSSGDYCAICTDYATVKARYNLDRPLVIGELYIGTDTPGRFETFYSKGYAGAWPWSLFPDHTSDRMAIDMTQASSFGAAHTDLGPR